MSEKQKLTLSVNKEVVQKAKDLGINISDITENILRGFTFDGGDADNDALYKKYEELLKVMQPLMQKHDFKIKIAEGNPFTKYDNIDANMEVFYNPDGSFWDSWNNEDFNDISTIEIYHFLSSSELLTNFIDQLSKVMEKRKQKIAELEMARRIVKAISEKVVGKQTTTSRKVEDESN